MNHNAFENTLPWDAVGSLETLWELGAREDRQAMQRLLADLVSLCICEFYHDSAASRE